MTDELPQRQILTISQLNRRARLLLETHLPLLWIRGEISNLARPGSGHWYFTLKDQEAQIRCAMFRNRNNRVQIRPRDGDQVLVRGRVGLYENRGEYQLIVEHMEADGAGLLQQRFEELKARLQAEGLFAQEHKKPLPTYPRRIAIVTSPTGAAVRDIIHVMARRCPWVVIDIYPTAVQGKEATAQIVKALEMANRGDGDLIILARGGGSIEDLWSFNEEAVARAIYASSLPVVSAVGHETDFTISDFAADARAPTPSAAAEIATPDTAALKATLSRLQKLLQQRTESLVREKSQRLLGLIRRLRSPEDQLREQSQHLDHLNIRMSRAMIGQVTQHKARLDYAKRRLALVHPEKQLFQYRLKTEELLNKLEKTLARRLSSHRQQLQGLAATLNAVSPLSTLARGYSISKNKRGQVISSIASVAIGDAIDVRVSDGTLGCEVVSASAINDSD